MVTKVLLSLAHRTLVDVIFPFRTLIEELLTTMSLPLRLVDAAYHHLPSTCITGVVSVFEVRGADHGRRNKRMDCAGLLVPRFFFSAPSIPCTRDGVTDRDSRGWIISSHFVLLLPLIRTAENTIGEWHSTVKITDRTALIS